MSFEKDYGQYKENVEKALDEYTAYSSNIPQAKVMEAMRYSLLSGGKRIRAVLALSFCRAFGEDMSLAMPAACALEMAHAYSLIHDDLPCMDNDDLRRGKPTCHKQFGESMAVLAGDGLLTMAFEVLSGDKSIEKLGIKRVAGLIQLLSRALGENGMLGGQVIDVISEGKGLSQEDHSHMVSMKTGELICASVLSGCICAGVYGGTGMEYASKARSYGEKIGRAFQITDDILDVTGSADVLGKNTGVDAKDGKVTFVSLYGVEKSQQMANELFASAEDDIIKLFGDKEEFLISLTRFLAGRQF